MTTATEREPFRIEFEPPETLAEAEDLRAQLLLDISSIQEQLSDPSRADRTTDYSRWRKGALVALRCKEEELRRLKRWIKEHQQSVFKASDWELHARAIRVLESLSELSDDGRRLLADLRARVPDWYVQSTVGR